MTYREIRNIDQNPDPAAQGVQYWSHLDVWDLDVATKQVNIIVWWWWRNTWYNHRVDTLIRDTSS
jgi:hypothetical protein